MHVEHQPSGLVVQVHEADETRELGRHLAGLMQPGCVVGLIGPLGAGKTFLARSIAESLGVSPLAISSPTYVLINEYEGRIPIYHFDTYRLESKEAFDDLGALEYFESPGICLVEWADRVEDRLPPGSWLVRFEPGESEERRILISVPETIARQLVSDLREPSASESEAGPGTDG